MSKTVTTPGKVKELGRGFGKKERDVLSYKTVKDAPNTTAPALA